MTNAYDTSRGNNKQRAARKRYLLETYRADVDVFDGRWRGSIRQDIQGVLSVPRGEGEIACRCYRCGVLLIFEALTVDRIKPGCKGGTYRRDNIRPSCARCATDTGNEVKRAISDKKRRRPVLGERRAADDGQGSAPTAEATREAGPRDQRLDP